MTWGYSRSFPRAILHVDGDSFFASVEVAKNPHLRGKPIITGKERGIVSACTYDVKARGVKRGMKLHEARHLVPDAVILPSDYESYSLFSERMYNIVRRYTPAVEEYSIDECFADLTGLRRALSMSYSDMGKAIKRDLKIELGMNFSIGLSVTKVLAKLASKFQKPDGFTVIPLSDADTFLAKTPVGDVWGIGPNTAAYVRKYGVVTALDLAQKDETWVRRMLTKPSIGIWRELHGTVVDELDTKGRHTYQSISKTKTFTPPSNDAKFIYSQLSKNVENACIKARRWKLATPAIFFFLKTQDFRYHGCEVKLPHTTCIPSEILNEIKKYFPHVYRTGVRYRATGITLLKLADNTSLQLDLFGAVQESQGFKQVFESIDAISAKYGKHAVFLGSSFDAMKFGAHLGERGDSPSRTRDLFRGETTRRRLSIPMMGEVL
jgi:DNA polymerase-4/DNA polymerase V